MAFSEKQMDDWFRYHQPGPKAQALHADVTQGADSLWAILHQVIRLDGPKPARFEAAGKAIRDYADILNAACPDGADKSAAMRSLRLARNATNEAIAIRTKEDGIWLMHERMALMEITKARWQANAAIAIGLADG